MRAAVLWDLDDLRIEELDLDPPRTGEVAIRMAASGVCRSDSHAVHGVHRHAMPIVLGHEGSAVVEEVGEGVTGVKPGDHVVCSWLPYCGSCRRCTAGRPVVCERLGVFDAGFLADGTTRFSHGQTRIHHNVPSSFAERSVVPANTVFPVDASLPLEQVALLGCAVMTGVGAVLNTARVRPDDSVLVIGCGGVGLSAIQGARIAGASPIVAVDVVPSNTVFPVDASLPLEQVALLGCAVMTGVGAVLNTAKVRPGDSVLVIGCGGVGLSAIQGARIAGASPIVAVDVVPSKLELAQELGATETVLAGRDRIPEGFDHAIECLGRSETIEQAMSAVAPGGTAVLVGMAAPGVRAPLDALRTTTKELTVVGSWYGSLVPPRDLPLLAHLLAFGELRLEPMIARTIALDGIHDALARFETGDEARSVIVYD